MIRNFLNPKGHENRNTGSKVKAILLIGLILPIGGVASGMVYVCSLRRRLGSLYPSCKQYVFPIPNSKHANYW